MNESTVANLNIKTLQSNQSWITFYRGISPNAYALPKVALKIDAKEWLESIFIDPENPLSASLISGLLSFFNYLPPEFLISLKQNDNFRKLSIPYLIKAKGLQDTGIAVCALSLPKLLDPLLKQCELSDTSSHLLSGLVSGVLATIVTQPLYTMKKSNSLRFTQMSSILKGMPARGSLILLSMTLMNVLNTELEIAPSVTIELSTKQKKK